VLGCEPEYLSNGEYGFAVSRPESSRESGTPAQAPVTVGLAELSICSEASALEHFFKLVYKDGGAGDRLWLRADSDRLGMEPGATLYLVAALNRPSEFFAVDLVRKKDGSFLLCGGGVFPALPKKGEILWTLPVLEIRILPGIDVRD